MRRLLLGAFGLSAAAVVITVTGCSSSTTATRSSAEETSADARVPPIVQEDAEFKVMAKVKTAEARPEEQSAEGEVPKSESNTSEETMVRFTNTTPRSIDRDRVLLDVVSYLAVPYHHGGNGKKGIDCSGFTSQVYASSLSKLLPRAAAEQYKVGRSVPKDSLQFGDLVFFNTRGRRVSHVGMYIEDDLFVHASSNFGVVFSSLDGKYFRKRYVGARRLVD